MSSPEISDFSDSDSEDSLHELSHAENKDTRLFYDYYKTIELSFFEVADEDDKKDFLIAAVVQNDVTVLKEHLEPSEWTIENENDGNSLLHIAILHRHKEVVDYFLSLKDYPLEHVNREGQTPVMLSLTGIGEFYDYVSYNLIRKGASLVNIKFEHGESLLHCVIQSGLVQVAKLLMEMGYDVNSLNDSGFSPLWYCLDAGSCDRIETELVTALLAFGADPTVGHMYGYNMFEYAVKFCSATAIEMFFYSTFDDYTSVDIHLEVLLTLAEEKSPFFYETLKHTNNVVLGTHSFSYYHLLFFIKVEYLRELMEKCAKVIRQVLTQVCSADYRLSGICDKFSFSNLELLLESDLKCDVINFITEFSDKFYFYFLVGCGCDELIVLERVCYLLSYGLTLNECNLQLFFRKYGYNELIKILLHMDIEVNIFKRSIRDVLLLFIYDVRMDIDEYLQRPYQYSLENICELLHYFARPEVKQLCLNVANDEFRAKNVTQPDVPLLVEIARNVFRKHFVQTFKIKNAKEFYSLLNRLPISRVHRKIITLETKLY